MEEFMPKETENQLVIVSAVITNNKGELLLLRRNQAVKRAPGKLELPSGKVDYGEDPLQALKRVVKEQTGLEGRASKLLGSKTVVQKKPKISILIFYNVFKVEQELLNNAKSEYEHHEELLWLGVDYLQQKDLEKNLGTMMSKLESHLGKSSGIDKIDENITTNGELTIFSDGGSRGNPGPSASGFVILNEDGEVMEEGGEYLGITTNNQAEYHAVRIGLVAAKKYKPSKISYKIDSLLVVNQMNGKFKIKNKDLWPIHEEIKRLAKEIGNVSYSHVPREQNELADAKVNEVLDSRKNLDQ